MTIGITGHRPSKLGNDYALTSPLIKAIEKKLYEILDFYHPDKVISGMALGIDTLWALIAIQREIPLIAAIPFPGQEKLWPQVSQDRYNHIIKLESTELRIISGEGYSPAKMQKRNEWMVDNCDILIAVWDGSSGGTANCVRYAESKKHQIITINPTKLLLEIYT